MGRRGPQPSGRPLDPVLALRLPTPERHALERLAAADGVSLSDLAREAIRRYLADRREDLVAAS